MPTTPVESGGRSSFQGCLRPVRRSRRSTRTGSAVLHPPQTKRDLPSPLQRSGSSFSPIPGIGIAGPPPVGKERVPGRRTLPTQGSNEAPVGRDRGGQPPATARQRGALGSQGARQAVRHLLDEEPARAAGFVADDDDAPSVGEPAGGHDRLQGPLRQQFRFANPCRYEVELSHAYASPGEGPGAVGRESVGEAVSEPRRNRVRKPPEVERGRGAARLAPLAEEQVLAVGREIAERP